MSTIQVVGHVCVDLVPVLTVHGVAAPGKLIGVGPLRISVGGAVGNCGRVLSELGVEVTLSGSVGDDELGAICRQSLEARGCEVDLTVVSDRATSYSIVVEPPGVDRSFWHHTGANDGFLGACEIRGDRLLHYGYPSLTPAMCAEDGRPIRALYERAHALGVATSLDLAFLSDASPVRDLDWESLFRAVLPECDVFCPSWDDIASSLRLPADASDAQIAAWADEAIGWGCAVVVVTVGRRGAYLRTAGADRLARLAACGIDAEGWADKAVWSPPPYVEDIATTNAAGDTYKAAFLYELARGGSVQGCLDTANRVVARHLAGLPLAGGVL